MFILKNNKCINMKNICFCIIYLTSILSLGNAVEYGSVINIDISSLNNSNNVFKIYETLQEFAEISINNIPSDFGYFVIQVHSFKEIILLSNTSDFKTDTCVNGTNIGLVDIRDPTGFVNSLYYLSGVPGVNTTILIVIIGYDIKDPLPGGCNLTFDIEIAPFQKVTTTNSMVRIDAQAPSIYRFECPEEEIRVEMYHMYLEEWDLTRDSYFAGIENMLTVENIRRNGRKVAKTVGFPNLRKYYVTYRGTGSVFAIVSSFRGFESAYVPVVSYGCDLDNSDDCYGPVSVYWKIFYGLMVFFGLCMCLQGHRLFQVSLFFTGFFVAAAFTYVILTLMNITDDETIIALGIIGVIYGAFWVTIWWKFGIPILSVTLSFIVAGYLLASTFFYIGLADLPVFQNDINYWSVLIGITLLITLALLVLSHLHSNILATSFVGAYIMIVPFDHYIGGNIRYIFLNTLHRATVPYFNLAAIDPPIQTNDQNLFISWLLVSLIGLYTQWRQNRGRAPFPPPPTTPRHVTLSESTPLLSARYA